MGSAVENVCKTTLADWMTTAYRSEDAAYSKLSTGRTGHRIWAVRTSKRTGGPDWSGRGQLDGHINLTTTIDDLVDLNLRRRAAVRREHEDETLQSSRYHESFFADLLRD